MTAVAPWLDLRSDTVTRPTPAMRRAMADAEVGDDVLMDDPTTNRFEAVVAERLGKEAALFFPSGTMANQAAIWVLSTPGTEIYVDAEAHIVHSEVAGSAALAGVQVRPVRGAGLVMTADELDASVRLPTADGADPSLVCVENTHNGPELLLISEVGIGIAWASIIAMPYAILASSLPQAKLGIYMGLFNVFIVIPQLLVSTLMGSAMKAWFPGQPIWTMAFAAGVMVLAALATLRVQEEAR